MFDRALSPLESLPKKWSHTKWKRNRNFTWLCFKCNLLAIFKIIYNSVGLQNHCRFLRPFPVAFFIKQTKSNEYGGSKMYVYIVRGVQRERGNDKSCRLATAKESRHLVTDEKKSFHLWTLCLKLISFIETGGKISIFFTFF